MKATILVDVFAENPIYRLTRALTVAGFLLGVILPTSAQPTNGLHYAPSLIPIFTNNPTALYVITNLMAAPQPPLIVPVVSHTNTSYVGTYWLLSSPAPLPFDPYPELPVYQVTTNSSTNGIDFIIDDRSVDYQELDAEDATNNPVTFQPMGLTIDTNGLYLEIPTNAYSAASNYFNVLIHGTTNGDFYDVISKTDLLLPQWTVENTVTGAVGNVTPVTLNQNGRTNLFVSARTAVIVIYTQPMAQEVVAGDSVTFTVAAAGGDLFYQWTFDGTNIYGATGSSYTINNVNGNEAGDYACIITGVAGSETSQTATLTVDAGSGDPGQTQPIGQRQDYTFRSGVTYYIGSTVQLYGNTTFEAGTIIKFDYTQLYPSLQVMGTVTCKGVSYNPSVLTTIDDNAFGEAWNNNSPQPYVTGVPYLDLSQVSDNLSLTNVWFRYADAAVSTPAGGQLDIWNGQFFQCDAAILNEFGGVDNLHNVLLAGCQEAIAADTNTFAVTAENITADVANLCTAADSPTYVSLTNSIVTGNANGAFLQNSVVAPDPSNFQTNGTGNYYLAASSALHQAGTANVSPYLLNEFSNKTTYPPVALPTGINFSGNLTLSPQVPRYTNGAPDIGYYYDALDYTVANFYNFGSITVLPGTAIGYREDSSINSYWGFDLREESSLVAHGTPTKPITFADVQWVQEQFAWPVSGDLVPDFEGATNDAAPVLDFRFCNFYAAVGWYQVWAGMNEYFSYLASYNSAVNWTLRDCNLHGGKISLGEPDNGNFYGIPYTTFYGVGAVSWDNNLFDNVLINLQPTYDYYDGTINVDLAFSAYNNLFHNNLAIYLVPVPASAGNWTFADNLFDQVNLDQYTGDPLNYDYNGYWPLTAAELLPGYASQLQTTATGDGFTDGGHEQVLSYAPPYQCGAFGNYYLSSLTALYEAGSRTAGAAGLAQYTVFANQSKDAANSPVNIGLHYVAATNGLPLDSDGDGIPDYVEDANGNGVVDAGETDPNNPITDGVTNDIYNAAYLDIDLSGDGLVGRVKAALGMNPLDLINPLTLKQVITGNEPDIVTYEVPISYSALTNAGWLYLNVDGMEAAFDELDPATDGNCLLLWNTTYNPPGFHCLSANFMIAGGSLPDTAIVSGQGLIAPFLSTNALQFFESDTMFDDTGAYLDAQLPEQDANYTIQLYDPSTTPPTFIKGITNSTSSGMIQETWDLTYDDGVTIFTNDTVTAVFNVSLLDPASGTHSKTLHKLVTHEQGNGFDFAYFYTPTNGSLSYDFGNSDGEVWNGMQAVVDTLLTPQEADGGSPNNYDSSFNNYTSEGNNTHGNGTSEGWPGYVSSRATVTNSSGGLYPSMADGTTKNFYGYGHGTLGNSGNGKYLASYNYQGDAYISSAEVANLLGNQFHNVGGLWTKNPYRFVFMDGCATMDTKDWRRAFGVFPLDAPNQAGLNKVGQQAFVGWAKEHAGNYVTADLAEAYTETLDGFYGDWMNQVPLAECIQNASDPNLNNCPFPVPGNEKVKDINGNTYVGETSKIFISGHTGLTRSSVDTTWENYAPYIPPPGNE